MNVNFMLMFKMKEFQETIAMKIRLFFEEDSAAANTGTAPSEQFGIDTATKLRHGQMLTNRTQRTTTQTFWYSVVIGMLCLACDLSRYDGGKNAALHGR